MENLHLTELMIKERMLKQELQKEYIKIPVENENPCAILRKKNVP